MSLYSTLLDLLFPPKCPFCGKLLEQGQALLCPNCQRDLPWTGEGQGERKGEFFTRCVAPLWYQEQVRQSHHRYKFSGVRAYAKPYGELMAQCVSDRLAGEFDVITWAPISRRRLWKRGYDQSRLLAQEIGARLGVPCVQLLDKVRHTPAQSRLSEDSERRANVLGAYALHPGAAVQGRRILLVDDVVTTGSTLSECARILRTAGGAQVVCAVLAAAGQENKESSKISG